MKPGPAAVASSISGLARRRSAMAAASFAGGCFAARGGDHGGVGCHVAVGGIARGRDLQRPPTSCGRSGTVAWRASAPWTDGLEQVGHEGCDAGNGAAVQGRSGERTGAGAVLPGANGSRLKST